MCRTQREEHEPHYKGDLKSDEINEKQFAFPGPCFHALRVVQQSKKSAPGFVIGGRTRKTYGAVCDDKNGGSF
jgi:hypothetical protein